MIFLYIMGNNYSLMWIEKSKTDEKFLEYSYQYQKKYPFIWNYLVKKIICNPEISYFRDTTGIIHINLIDYKKLQNFFEILKGYLNIGVIEKVIYKKEFIIIHFNKTFHMEYFTNVSFLLSINLYFFLLNKYDNIFKIYYGAILSYENERKLIEIVIEYKNKYYLFDGSMDLTYKVDDDVVKIYLCDFPHPKFRGDSSVKIFKLVNSDTEYDEQIKKIVMV